MQRIMGIDPGAHGAIALIVDGKTNVEDMPIVAVKSGSKTKNRIVPAALATIIRDWRPDHVFIELVGAMPGQGVSSMFSFGKAAGYAEGIPLALGFPVTLVTPVQWKQALRVPADKGAARLRASQLMPDAACLWTRAKDDGRAEAALIALYGSRSWNSLAKPSIEW